jgi:uridine kinase
MEKMIAAITNAVRQIDKPAVFIAIDGRCAAGKTTFAALLAKQLACHVIHMDDFFLRPAQRTPQRLAQPGGNIDYERFIDEVLTPLKLAKPFRYQAFDCKTMQLTVIREIMPNPITIIEGSYSCHPAFGDFYDLQVFLDVNPEKQMQRIQMRNGKQAAIQFRDRWIPLEESYFQAFQVQQRCQFVFQT